jgi:hypothetical protein
MAASDAVLRLLVTLKDEASSGLSSLGSTLGSLGTIAGGAALAGVAALGGAIVSGIGDAREAQQVMAQTEAVIKSTGGAAGYSAQQIADMAGSLSAASGQSLFGDDDIQRGQNMLLTFTNIKETLPDTTQTMLDMAQALGTDAGGAAVQLGKALNDPINGITALSRVGVTFTDQQKEQIKTMQNAGDMAGAQKVILAELNKEFGGSALAAAQADGGVAQFWDRIGEAKETLGAVLLPLLGQLMGILNDTLLPIVERGAEIFKDWVGTLEDAGKWSRDLGDAVTWLTALFIAQVQGVDQNEESVNSLYDSLAPLRSIINTVQAAAQEVFNTLIEQGKPILDDLGKIIMPALAAAGRVLASLWTNVLSPALQGLWYIFKTYLLPAIGELIHILSIVLPPIIDTVAAVFTDVLYPAIGGIIGALDQVGQAVEGVIGWFQNLGSSITSIEIPDWLQGHSPPPLANWFDDIAGAAAGAQESAGGMAFGGGAPLAAAPAFAGAGAGGGAATVYITVQGSVVTEGELVAKIRDGLIQIGYRNTNIFNGLADGGV